MIVKVCGKRWRLVFEDLGDDDGSCDSPDAKNKRVVINTRVTANSQAYMETVLHELLHAAVWSLDEEYVHDYAADAARILHRLGFRK